MRPRWAALLSPRLAAIGLIAAGASPALALAVLPGGIALLAAPRTGIVLVAALVFAPAIVAAAAALYGFEAVRSGLRAVADDACSQPVARVLLGGLIFAWVLGLLAALPADPVIPACMLVAALELGAAWLFLLYLMFDPARAGLLRHLALVCDLTLLSLLLAVGGGRTAALAPIYLYVAIGYADQPAPRARAAAIALSAVAFAVVVLFTPFWRDQLPLVAGMLGTMILLPISVGARLRQFRAARIAAEAANAAKDRFLTALNEDLREPLRAVARAGAELERDAVDPGVWSAVAEARLYGRTLLLQLDDVLNCIKLEAGSTVAETRTFDLYRLANGAVAALRAAAAECDALLDLRIDPQLPYQLYGLPHQLRQILISLVASALRFAGQSKVRIDLAAAELNAQSVTLRVAVSVGEPDGRLETADEAPTAGETGHHFGLAAVKRMAELMGGRLAVHATRRRVMLAADLPFAIDQAFLTQPLDLGGLPALIVSDDAGMVDALAEPLEAWRGDPRWIGVGEVALDYLDAFERGARRALLIVDGRGDVLQTLSWAHRAAALRAPEPPHILFIADEPRIDSIIGLAGGELDVILPAPLTPDVLRGALHSLTIEPISELAAHVPALPAATRPPRRQVVAEPAMGEEAVHEPADFAPLRAPSPQSLPKHEVPANRPWQVLIAAGNVSNRRIMGSLLGQAGHVVHFATTADEARKKLEALEIDVLLLDLAGARGTDYEAARRCRRARPGVIIIVLTTDTAEEAERRAREIGLDAVLRKPVRTRPLLAAIEAAVASKTPLLEAPSVVTSLSAHPRFTADATTSERPTGILPLRQSSAFFPGLIDNFRGDCRRIVAGLGQAASAGDAAAFEAGLRALRDSTADFEASRLHDLTQAMRGQSPAVLRRQGADYVQLLDAELRRLDAALVERLSAAN